METLLELLKTLNSLSPLAVIALLGIVLFYQARNKTQVSSKMDDSFTTITDNHLHDLPSILEILQRMETANATAFATIIAKLNGGHK